MKKDSRTLLTHIRLPFDQAVLFFASLLTGKENRTHSRKGILVPYCSSSSW